MDRHAVLLVEDDPMCVIYCKEIFHKLNFELHIAVTGREALERIRNHNFNLVLLDIKLPDISGFVVAEEKEKPTLIYLSLFNQLLLKAV